MKGGRVLFGFIILLIGGALFFLSGSIYSWIGIGLGALIFLWGLFSRKKRPYVNDPREYVREMKTYRPPAIGDTQVMPRYGG